MATLHKEIVIALPPSAVWSAIRDIEKLHTRLVPGFVIDTRLEGDERIVTFANGTVMRERILSVDEARRRLAWAALGGELTHYNAVIEVHAAGDATRVVWTTDLLPRHAADKIGLMQDEALRIMKRTLEGAQKRQAPQEKSL